MRFMTFIVKPFARPDGYEGEGRRYANVSHQCKFIPRVCLSWSHKTRDHPQTYAGLAVKQPLGYAYIDNRIHIYLRTLILRGFVLTSVINHQGHEFIFIEF